MFVLYFIFISKLFHKVTPQLDPQKFFMFVRTFCFLKFKSSLRLYPPSFSVNTARILFGNILFLALYIICMLSLSPDSVRSLRRTNARKAPGPHDVPGRVLRDCAEELTDVFTDIFNTYAEPSCCPDVPQSHHHHLGPEEAISLLLQQLPPGRAHSHHYEVL